MRAVVLDRPGGPEAFRIQEIDAPSPGPGEVAIDVAFAGVGFVDTLFRKGVFPLPPPIVVGLEVAGAVREIGPGVANLRAAILAGGVAADRRGPVEGSLGNSRTHRVHWKSFRERY